MFIKITDGVDAHFAFKYYASGILQFTVKTGRWGDTITNDNDRKLVTHQYPGIVTLAEIKEAIKRGAVTAEGVKHRCGTGMGNCQGSRCTRIIEELLEETKC